MRRLNFLLLVGLCLLPVEAAAEDRENLLSDCETVAICLEILNPTVREKDTGVYDSDVDAIRRILKSRFGDAAKYALLEKTVGAHGGWRNLAGAILRHWDDWNESDVPKLREALKLNPGGWIALPLAEIGTQEAIDALIEDLIENGGASQTDFALKQIGPKVLKSLLPALKAPSYTELPDDAPYTEGWRAVVNLIQEFGSEATIVADEWISIARNIREEPTRRIAALRGIGAMNGYLGEKSASLRRLQNDHNKEIANLAYQTLIVVHDSSVARRFAQGCNMGGKRWDDFSLDAFSCLKQLSEFGSNALAAGDIVEPFLNSENKSEQLYAIETLGLIGYEAAIPKIESFLSSNDWRHVYAATRALGQLKSRQSVPAIEAATKHHWLWELNYFGGRTAQLLIKNQPYSLVMGNPWKNQFFGGFGNYYAPYDQETGCDSAMWEYRGKKITFDDPSYEEQKTITLQDGLLIGTDQGEFGGDLSWHPKNGNPITLISDNVLGLFEIDGGYISIHGISHMGISYGFAALITRDDNSEFQVKEIARFPAAAYRVKKLEDGLLAANASGRVIIFNRDGIVEAAYCDMSARPNKVE